MKVLFTKTFEKNIKEINDSKTKSDLLEIILVVKKASSLAEIPNLKKLKGYKFYYRIRLRDYRIGIYFEKDIIEFARFAHRKEIYRFFP
ncbi:MAG: type II toxin-antitoxin system RelE/ParE family toxin [Candidatus Methylacidiphilales bacterium]